MGQLIGSCAPVGSMLGVDALLGIDALLCIDALLGVWTQNLYSLGLHSLVSLIPNECCLVVLLLQV